MNRQCDKAHDIKALGRRGSVCKSRRQGRAFLAIVTEAQTIHIGVSRCSLIKRRSKEESLIWFRFLVIFPPSHFPLASLLIVIHIKTTNILITLLNFTNLSPTKHTHTNTHTDNWLYTHLVRTTHLMTFLKKRKKINSNVLVCTWNKLLPNQ